ncbi:MAG: hypothetical protein IBX69_15770 [Anaerolineales bacterium]|nr:hypothetical protein [Anaerolineales bacterium]
MLQVIGAGFGRTGTHSLARALGELGFGPCYTLLDVDKHAGHVDLWNAALEGRAVDWRPLFKIITLRLNGPQSRSYLNWSIIFQRLRSS